MVENKIDKDRNKLNIPIPKRALIGGRKMKNGMNQVLNYLSSQGIDIKANI